MWLRRDTSSESVCVSVFRCGPMFCYVCSFVVLTKVTKAEQFLTEAKQYFTDTFLTDKVARMLQIVFLALFYLLVLF